MGDHNQLVSLYRFEINWTLTCLKTRTISNLMSPTVSCAVNQYGSCRRCFCWGRLVNCAKRTPCAKMDCYHTWMVCVFSCWWFLQAECWGYRWWWWCSWWVVVISLGVLLLLCFWFFLGGWGDYSVFALFVWVGLCACFNHTQYI